MNNIQKLIEAGDDLLVQLRELLAILHEVYADDE